MRATRGEVRRLRRLLAALRCVSGTGEVPCSRRVITAPARDRAVPCLLLTALSLSRLQPWLLAARESTGERGRQAARAITPCPLLRLGLALPNTTDLTSRADEQLPLVHLLRVGAGVGRRGKGGAGDCPLPRPPPCPLSAPPCASAPTHPLLLCKR